MKFFSFMAIALMTTGTMADTFYADESIAARTNSNYVIAKSIDVDVLAVYHNETARIKVNGQEKEVKLTLKSVSRDSYELEYTYEAIIKEDVLEAGYACDEMESVSYVLKFDFYTNQRDPHDADWTSLRSLKVIHQYSYDICHDFSPETNIVEYKRK